VEKKAEIAKWLF